MNIKDLIGRVVWHDLIINDVAKAKHFYAELLGWEYKIEHTADFVWKPGEGDYPLIIVNQQVHGGFIELAQNIVSQWVAYVSVENVDVVTTKAKALGATIERKPFDVPGVGRSAMIRDPQGAIICPFSPTHNLPPPKDTFLWDELITNNVEDAKLFYRELFGWKSKVGNMHQFKDYTVFKTADNTQAVGGVMNHSFCQGRPAAWVPYLATDNLDLSVSKAKALGAGVQMEVTEVPDEGRFAILKDSCGAEFGLFTPLQNEVSKI